MGAIGPKNRISKAAGAKRKAQYKLEQPGLAKCSKCGAYVQPHRVCKQCGTYNKRQVVEVSED